MNTRGDTIGTAPPRPTQHTRALPTAADHWGATTINSRAHAAQIPHRPPADEETTRQPQDHLVSPVAPTMKVKPAAAGLAVNRDDPRQADLAQKDPLVQADTARPRNTLDQRMPARKAWNCPAHAADTQLMQASLGSPTAHYVEHKH